MLLTDNEIAAVRSNPTRILMRQPMQALAVDFDRSGNLVVVVKQKTGLELHWFSLSESS